MSQTPLHPLESIALDARDMELFPQEVVDLYLDAPRGPMNAYTALKRHNRGETNPERKRLQAEALDNLRLWAWPSDAPSLYTFNGIGASLYGKAQRGDDGTYIATQWLTFIFVPVLALGSYLVTPAEDGWLFHGRTPDPPWVRIPHALWGLLAFVGLGTMVVGAINNARNADVVVYNGMGSAVEIAVGGERFHLEAGAHREVSLAAEVVQVETTLGGGEFESFELDLSGSAYNLTVYNVGARGVLVVDFIVYGNDEPPADFVVGGRISTLDAVDYVFADPPEQKSVRQGGSITNSILHPLDVDSDGMALNVLAGAEMMEHAGMFSDSAVRDGSTDRLVLGVALSGAIDAGRSEGEVCKGWLAERPDSVELHRFCQDARVAKEGDAVLAEYVALAEAHPDSAMYAYLLGRKQDGAESLRSYERALQIDPNHGRSLFAIAYQLVSTNTDVKRAAALLEQVGAIEPALVAESTELLVITHRLLGADAAAIALKVDPYDSSLFSLPDMLRLQADPGLYEHETARLGEAAGDLADGELSPAYVNMFGNVAMIAGEIDDLRHWNELGAGLDLHLALSDGATAEERKAAFDGSMTAGREFLAFTHEALNGRDGSALLDDYDQVAPALVEYMRATSAPTVAGLGKALYEAPPTMHAPAWFWCYRVTGNKTCGRRAVTWADAPSSLPYFTL